MRGFLVVVFERSQHTGLWSLVGFQRYTCSGPTEALRTFFGIKQVTPLIHLGRGISARSTSLEIVLVIDTEEAVLTSRRGDTP